MLFTLPNYSHIAYTTSAADLWIWQVLRGLELMDRVTVCYSHSKTLEHS